MGDGREKLGLYLLYQTLLHGFFLFCVTDFAVRDLRGLTDVLIS